MTPSARPDTRLAGRSLRLARLVWLAVALLYGFLMLASTPTNFSAENAARILANNFRDWSPAQISQAFADLRLTPRAFINFSVLSDVLLGPVYFALGLFLVWRRSDDWLALLFSATFMTFLSANDIVDVLGRSPLTLWLDNLAQAVGSFISICALLAFPDGRLVPRWTRWVILWTGAVQLWRVFLPEAYLAWGFALTLPGILTMAISQLYRYFRVADALQRQQIKWAVFGVGATTLPLAVFILALISVPSASQPGASGLAFLLLGTSAWTAFLILWPTGLAISILRYRLWDIDVLIRRTLVYSALTALLALAYFGSVLVLQNLFRTITGQDQGQLVAVLSTLAIAALFGPLRARVQAWIDRRFYRQKYDAARTLAAFGEHARDEVDLETLTGRLLTTVDETMQPDRVSLWLRKIDQRPRSAHASHRDNL